MFTKKRIIRYVILVLVLFLALLITIFSIGDFKSIYYLLKSQTNYTYILIGIISILIYAFLMQSSFAILVRKKYKDISYNEAIHIGGTEFFFNGITPFSTGGQPFQLYALKQKNMKLSDATSALLVNFLIYQIIINIFSIICFSLYYNKLKLEIDNLIWLVVFGFTINVLIMTFIVLIGTTKFFGKFMVLIFKLFCKIKFLKKRLEPKIISFEVYVNEMQDAFKQMAQNKLTMMLIFIIKIIALFIYYLVPFFIFYAVGVKIDYHDIFYVIAMTSFSITITAWVPTPGAAGGIEFAFTTLFYTFISNYTNPQNIVVSCMLLWRLLTYYLMMIYGFVMYLLFERGIKYEDRVIH